MMIVLTTTLQVLVLNLPCKTFQDVDRVVCLIPTNASPTRQRRINCDYGLGNDPILPPSISQRRGLNLNQMFSGFDDVAKSLNVLVQSNRFRRVIDSHNDIIEAIERRQQLENSGIVNGDLHNALTNKIAALNQDFAHDNSFDNQLRLSDTTMDEPN